MAVNFITQHIVRKINELIKSRQLRLKHQGFLYFNNPTNGKRKINRVNTFNPFEVEELLPLNFYHLEGETLIEIYKKLKSNDFFIYKRLEDGKDYKIRLKQ
jgi:hypothetical protein